MFLRETVIKKASGEYRYWRLVRTYWDKKQKKVRHKTVAQLGKLKPEELEFFRHTLNGKAGRRFSWEDLAIKKSFEYLGPAVLDRIWRYWELDKVIPERAAEVLAVNRCLRPDSDYRVSRWYEGTILSRMLDLTLNPTKIYRALDRIHPLNEAIQEHLYKRISSLGLDDYELIFYDITSSYFEQSKCPIVKYGFSREHRRDRKQIILALAVTKRGFPFYWKILPGNTADTRTVKNFTDELKNRFKIKKAALVMDRGMVSKTNLEKIRLEEFDYVVTLIKSAINKIKDMPWGYLKTINESNVHRKKDAFTYYSERTYYRELKPDNEKRYILCFNPGKFLEERRCRLEKIESIKKRFEKRNKELSQAKKIRYGPVLREELKKYLEKRAAKSMFKFRLSRRGKAFHINYRIIKQAVREAAKLDGIYVVMSNLKKASPKDLIRAYHGRMEVERTFHQLKSFVEIRPVYHHNEQRIESHVIICILAYLLNNTVTHMVRQKKDFEELTAQAVYSYLESCKLVELSAAGEKKLKLTDSTTRQAKLTELLTDMPLLSEDSVKNLLK